MLNRKVDEFTYCFSDLLQFSSFENIKSGKNVESNISPTKYSYKNSTV